MKEQTIVFLVTVAVLIVCLVISLIKIRQLKNVIFFLNNVSEDNKIINSTRFLASLGIKNLNRFGYKLIPFFRSVFMLSTIEHNPITLNKISDYIQRLKHLKNSPEKSYLLNSFRISLLDSGVESLAFIIYQMIKIKHRDRGNHGEIIEAFLLEDAEDLRVYVRELELVIHKINFYEKGEPVLCPKIRKLIRENLDEVIKILVKTNKKV
jgi:hypothetical protein